MVLRGLLVLCALWLGACSTPQDTPRPPLPGDQEVTLRGVVQAGVEPGCLVLSTGDRQYLLLGVGEDLVDTGEVVLRGRPQPDRLTTCQQGVPFTVTHVEGPTGRNDPHGRPIPPLDRAGREGPGDHEVVSVGQG